MSKSRAVFRAELAQLVAKLEIPEDTTAYLCGPVPFLRAMRAQLLEAGVTDIHYEVFGPDLAG